MTPRFVLATGNRHKVDEAERILGYRPETVALDLPEIQSLDVELVLRAKGEDAWRRLQRPVVVDETSLELYAMNGFPGPLVKWMLDAVGADGIAAAAHALGDAGATARCALLYRDRDQQLFVEGVRHGRLSRRPRGPHGFGWDSVFVPGRGRRTFAELPCRVKDREGHRGRAWAQLLRKLCQKPG